MAAVGCVLSCRPPPLHGLESRKLGLEADLAADSARKLCLKPTDFAWGLWAALVWLFREVLVVTVPGGDLELWH